MSVPLPRGSGQHQPPHAIDTQGALRSMDLGLILLRLAHVVAGAAWVGGAFVMILLVSRTAQLRGADGDAFMTTLLTKGKAARYFEIAAITTVLAGSLLYFRASNGFQLDWI